MSKTKHLYIKTGNDEAYTPDYAVRPILKFIPKNSVIWCPFDTEDSAFVRLIRENGNKVIHSHISEGKDFFTYEPDEHWDIIISNPPFKNKKEFFKRALSFGKPIALLMTLTWLNDKGPKEVFFENNKQLQLLLFDKRINYNNPYGKPNNRVSFGSAYYCYNFLPRDIMYEKLQKI